MQRGRPVRQQTTPHLFTIGQSVRLKGGFARLAVSGDVYQITATLPPTDGSPQYRIRNQEERYERVTTQDSLEPVDTSVGGATLIERTFGHV